jgi:hypothetical protein
METYEAMETNEAMETMKDKGRLLIHERPSGFTLCSKFGSEHSLEI